MPLNFTPLSWKTITSEDPQQMRLFFLQLADFLTNGFTPGFLSSALNGQLLLQSSSLFVVSTQSTVTTNQTLACSNAAQIFAFYQLNTGTPATWTLTLSNLPLAIYTGIKIFNNSAGAVTVKFVVTDKNGATCSAFANLSGGTSVDMVGTGRSVAVGANAMYVGSLSALAGQANFIAI